MIKAITHILHENYTDAAVIEGVEIAEIVTWLEKQKGNQYFVGYLKGYSEGQLNPKQKEQKPAEWSEDDEEKMRDLVSLLAILEGCSTVNVGTTARYDGWLNSLRSRPKSSDNWKPSEEQMIALYNMIPFVKSECGPSEAVKPLESLYEDLKKL